MHILSQRKFIASLFVAAFIFLTCSLFFAYQQINKALDSNNWIWHTYEVIIQVDQLDILLVDIQSRVDQFVLSKDTAAIQVFKDESRQVYQKIQILKNLTQDNPSQQIRIAKITTLVNEKLAFANTIISTVATEPNTVQLLAIGKERLRLRNQISAVLSEITDEEIQLLKIRNSKFYENRNLSIQELILSVMLAEFTFVISLLLLNYYLKNQSQLQSRLKDSEERYELATEGSHSGLWDWRQSTNEIYFSPYFKRTLGYTDEEFPNTIKALNEHLHPDDFVNMWKAVKLHLDKKAPYNIEHRLRSKANDYKWFQSAGQALWDKNGKPVRMSGSLIDITDKKNAEQRLAVQYEIIQILSSETDLKDAFVKVLQTLYKILPFEIAIVWDVIGDRSSLVCTEFWYNTEIEDKTFENLTRQSFLSPGQDATGKVFQTRRTLFISNITEDKDFTHSEEAAKIGLHSAYFVPISAKKDAFGVLEFLTFKQSAEDKDLMNMLAYVGHLMGEYLEREEAAKELRESEIYKSAILDSASESIITINEDGMILSCNLQTNTMFLYAKESLIDKKIELLLPEFPDLFSKLKSKKIIECEAIQKYGKRFDTEVVISELNLKGRASYVLIVRDISARKKIEKMKNEFISMVSHELRTPLTSIQGSLDLTLDGTVGEINKDARELLEIAKQNSERLIRLINDILDIEKIEAGKMEFKLQETDIHAVVEEAVAFNNSYAKRHKVNIQCINSAGQVYVNVDRDRTIQVLTNLLSNAVKYTPAGKTVDVSITAYDKMVRVAVIDKGQGISEEFRENIFKKFAQEDSTTTRSKGGTGLGLSISKAIVENMHGVINYTSSDKGSTFYFDLPIQSPEITTIDNSSAINESEIDEAGQNKKINILHIENDEDFAQITHKSLEHLGHVYNVKSRHAALAAIRNNHYDLVILDLMLADGFAADLISEIHDEEIPIIVYSAYELPPEYAQKIQHILTKSKSSYKKLLSLVQSIFNE